MSQIKTSRKESRLTGTTVTCSVVATVCTTVTGATELPGGACERDGIRYDVMTMTLVVITSLADAGGGAGTRLDDVEAAGVGVTIILTI